MTWFNFNAGDVAVAFLSVLLEGIPFLLLGSLISGLVDAFVSPERLAKILPKNPVAAVCASGLLGLLFPMCECGSVVVIRRFLRKGLPVGCAVSYMLGAPIVSPIVALSTYAAFRGQHPLEMTILRLGMGFLIAVAVGLVMQRIPSTAILQDGVIGVASTSSPRSGFRIAAMGDSSAPEEPTFANKLMRALYAAATDFLDFAVFFVIGAAITSILGTAVHRSVLDPIASNPPLAIFGSMGVAAALALCSTTDAFNGAKSFPAFPMGAKLGFLVFGPMVDLKLYWLYGLLFKRRTVALLSLSLFVVIGLLCWRLNGIIF